MLKKKLGKKVAALASAAVMAVSATATGLTALSMTAFAGAELGEGTFNEGKGLPWHICESATGVMKFDITDGIYAILIENPGGTGNGGEDRWDCQFRHRNLTIEDGHIYRLTYSVKPSQSGRMYSKLGDMADPNKETWHGNGEKLTMTYEEGISQEDLEAKLLAAPKTGQNVDYGQGWDAWKNETLPANQWTTVAFEFKAQGSSTGTGEWTFHMGGTGQYTQQECFPKGTVILFDNLALMDLTDDNTDYPRNQPEYEPKGIEVNQIGYYPNAKKQATLILADDPDHTKANQPASEQISYEIKDAKGATVHEGTTSGEVIYDEGGWNWNQVIDFTDFTTEGTNYKLVVDGKESIAFDIDSNLYGAGHVYDESMLTYAVNYYYQNRSGVTTEDAYIPSGQTDQDSGKTLGRKDCHNPDTAYLVDEWVMQYTSMPSKGSSLDCTGGWYDAGDYGKYVVNGGISLWTLMNMYERSVMVNKADKWEGTDIVNIPASDGVNTSVSGAPNILNECKVELDFFLKMQRSDGMVYHKMHDYKWTGLAVAPYDDDGKEDGAQRPMRIVKPTTYAATLNFAAACAQGARLFKQYDSSYAATLEAAAIKAYDAAKTNYKPFTDWTTNSNGNISGDYARVSTDSDEQLTSYEAQVDYYTHYIKERPDWTFAGMYADEGISGTNTKRREGFNQMIADALAGKIDLIVTKSVSRFARNTVDSLTTVRKLKEKGVEVYFQKENIYTLDSKGELLITIMSSLAQEESRSISENVTWGCRKRFADGKVSMPYKNFLGYRKGGNGEPEIVPEEAEVPNRRRR